MCGRYRRTTQEEELARLYHIPIPKQTDLPISYNIAPSQKVLAIRFNAKSQQRSLDALQWGLIPYWAKDPKIAYRTKGFTRGLCPNVSGSLDRFQRCGHRGLLPMSTNYFGEGLRAKLGELKLKYEAFAKDAGISEKTVRRAIKGEEVDETTKQSIVGALGTSIDVLESLGRSRILSRVWVPPVQNEQDIYELTEILDAHHLFRAVSGKILGYGITQPQLETETTESDTVIRTNFEQLTKLQEFLISLMLIAPIDPVNATCLDPTDWDRKLKELEAMKYVLFIGIDRPHSRIVLGSPYA